MKRIYKWWTSLHIRERVFYLIWWPVLSVMLVGPGWWLDVYSAEIDVVYLNHPTMFSVIAVLFFPGIIFSIFAMNWLLSKIVFIGHKSD